MPVTLAFWIFLGLFSRKMDRKPFFFPCIVDWTHLFHFEILNPFKTKKNVSFLGKRDFCTVFCDRHYILAYLNKSINFVTKSRMPYLLWCVFIFSLCLRNTFSKIHCIPFSKIHVYRWTTGSFWALWRALHFFKR